MRQDPAVVNEIVVTPEKEVQRKKLYAERLIIEQERAQKRFRQERAAFQAAKEKTPVHAPPDPKKEDSNFHDPFQKLAGSNADSWGPDQPGSVPGAMTVLDKI
jgi:hypothetical protein